MNQQIAACIFCFGLISMSYGQNLCEKISSGEVQCETNFTSEDDSYEQKTLKITKDSDSINMKFLGKKVDTGDVLGDYFRSLDTSGPSFFIPESGKDKTPYKLLSSGIFDDWETGDSGKVEEYSKTLCRRNKITVFTKTVHDSGIKKYTHSKTAITLNKENKLVISKGEYIAICTLNL